MFESFWIVQINIRAIFYDYFQSESDGFDLEFIKIDLIVTILVYCLDDCVFLILTFVTASNIYKVVKQFIIFIKIAYKFNTWITFKKRIYNMYIISLIL